MSNTLGGVVISQAPRDMGCNEILQRISSESDDSSNRCRHPMQRSLTNSSIGSFDALDENDLEGIGEHKNWLYCTTQIRMFTAWFRWFTIYYSSLDGQCR